jgi:hypothetical protein
VRKVLEQGFRTPDLARSQSAGIHRAFDNGDGREGAGDGEDAAQACIGAVSYQLSAVSLTHGIEQHSRQET